jgi:hypothetical protein
MGQATYGEVRHEFAQRVKRGEFLAVGHGEGRAAPLNTTAEMVRMEQEIIGRMQSGNQRTYSDPMLVSPPLRIAIEDRHTELSRAQLRAVDDIFVSREKIVGLDGIAGTGKTTTLAVIREGAEAEGYKVEGFAPTSRAVVYDTAYEGKLYEGKVKTEDSRARIPIPQRVRPYIEAWRQACPDTSPDGLMFPTKGHLGNKGNAVPFRAKNFFQMEGMAHHGCSRHSPEALYVPSLPSHIGH